MCIECVVGFENCVLLINAVCAYSSDRRIEHVSSDRHPGRCLGGDMDWDCPGNPGVNDATLRFRQKQAIATRSTVRPNSCCLPDRDPRRPASALTGSDDFRLSLANKTTNQRGSDQVGEGFG